MRCTPVWPGLACGLLACAGTRPQDNAIGALIPPASGLNAGAPELFLPRHPALSPDGGQVAFSHQGDVWVADTAGPNAGLARRLTAHDAYEGSPKWSPDGTRLAFTSTRHGNTDLFWLPAEGGAPARVTWNSESEALHGWIDGERLLFTAAFDRYYNARSAGAWAAHVDGATPASFGDWPLQRPALAPDGRLLCYERGAGDPRRRAYRGAAASNLWLCDRQTGEHRALTEHEGSDFWPMWSGDGGSVYFLSDRACPGNESGRDLGLWRVPAAGGRPQLVFHPGGRSLRFPGISADGRSVVAELDAGLVWIDTASGAARPLPVRGSYDPSEPDLQDLSVNGGASEPAVAPDGESIAFVARGDVYVLRKHEKIRRAARVTRDPAPDATPLWVEDGKALLFVSERDGNGEIYRVRPKDADTPFYKAVEFVEQRLTATAEDESGLQLAPDGKTLAWVQGLGRLVVGDPATAAVTRTLVESFAAPSFAWSPDSAWIAYSAADNDFNEDVFLARVAIEGLDPAQPGVVPYNLTTHPDNDGNPQWSPDGRKLTFTSRRQLIEETDVWVAFLRQDDAEQNERERLEAEEERSKKKKDEPKPAVEPKAEPTAEPAPEVPAAEPQAEAKPEAKPEQDEKKDDTKDDKQEEVEPVQIDFTGLRERLRRVTRNEGNESALGFDAESKLIYFNASPGTQLADGTKGEEGLFQVELHGGEQKRLEPAGVGWFTRRAKEIFYVKNGAIHGRASEAKEYPFAVTVREDKRALRTAVLEQAWRALDRGFYDPGFHGHDWAASLEKWRPIALAASTREDFGEAVNWMLGEMNASHMGYSGAGSSAAREQDRSSTGQLGVLWEESYAGPGRQVRHVLPDTPASRAASRLQPGDVVLAVNGAAYAAGDNWDRLLHGTEEQETRLLVRSAAGEEREVLIRPTSNAAFRNQLYRDWARRNRATVERDGGGRLGYVHIEGMGTGSLEEFERALFDAGAGKDGLLIDVRGNGGGWTTDMILSMLMVRDHAITRPRGGGDGYPQDRRVFAVWTKPVVVLCDELSYSNAEIFSWSIKTLGRGPVVGKQTYGAVISTGGAGLLDGSFVRLPFRGWYVNDETRTNMELHGCPPDHPVEILPGDYAAGRDPQLVKAIEVGLDEIR